MSGDDAGNRLHSFTVTLIHSNHGFMRISNRKQLGLKKNGNHAQRQNNQVFLEQTQHLQRTKSVAACFCPALT